MDLLLDGMLGDWWEQGMGPGWRKESTGLMLSSTMPPPLLPAYCRVSSLPPKSLSIMMLCPTTDQDAMPGQKHPVL